MDSPATSEPHSVDIAPYAPLVEAPSTPEPRPRLVSEFDTATVTPEDSDTAPDIMRFQGLMEHNHEEFLAFLTVTIATSKQQFLTAHPMFRAECQIHQVYLENSHPADDPSQVRRAARISLQALDRLYVQAAQSNVVPPLVPSNSDTYYCTSIPSSVQINVNAPPGDVYAHDHAPDKFLIPNNSLFLP